MSLKIFHIIFICCSIAITLGFSVWAFLAYRQNAQAGYLVAAIAAIGAGIGLIVYGSNFLKKMKKIL